MNQNYKDLDLQSLYQKYGELMFSLDEIILKENQLKNEIETIHNIIKQIKDIDDENNMDSGES